MVLYPEGGGVRSVYMTGGGESHGASHCEAKKIYEPEILHPKNTWPCFLPKRIQDLHTSIVIYLIKQPLRPKKKRDRSLHPPKIPRV